MLGLEPPTSGVNERIVRLCGVRSDVTPLSVGKHQPFLPPFLRFSHSKQRSFCQDRLGTNTRKR
jgi:hypothetical protein